MLVVHDKLLVHDIFIVRLRRIVLHMGFSEKGCVCGVADGSFCYFTNGSVIKIYLHDVMKRHDVMILVDHDKFVEHHMKMILLCEFVVLHFGRNMCLWGSS